MASAAAHLLPSLKTSCCVNNKNHHHRCSTTNRSRSARRHCKGTPYVDEEGHHHQPAATYVAAVKKLQRAIRHFVAIKNTVDPITLDAVNNKNSHDVLFVEASGTVAFRFDARALIAHFLLSSRFLHPVIGRELLKPEVRRAGVHAGFGGQALIALYSLRDVAVKHKTQRESLSTFMENEMRNILTRALKNAEAVDQALTIHPFDDQLADRLEQEVIDDMDDYCSLAERSARCDPESCRASLKADMAYFACYIHETTINADDLSPGERIVYSALKDAEDDTRDRCKLDRPKTALGGWLNDIWKGR